MVNLIRKVVGWLKEREVMQRKAGMMDSGSEHISVCSIVPSSTAATGRENAWVKPYNSTGSGSETKESCIRSRISELNLGHRLL